DAEAPGIQDQDYPQFSPQGGWGKATAVAEQHGLFSCLQELFRWKPEIDKKAWDAAEEQVTRVLSAAITTAPGKPSVTIEQEV
ncbi:MAG TPA: hypothetical protein PK364_12700, partial [Synergistaceae bacterium]|nr:hypothetical protein [Synergistaceae bacterium]